MKGFSGTSSGPKARRTMRGFHSRNVCTVHDAFLVATFERSKHSSFEVPLLKYVYENMDF